MIYALQSMRNLIETACMPLCANVHPHLNYLSLFSFYRLAVDLKVLMLESLPLSHTTGSLVL